MSKQVSTGNSQADDREINVFMQVTPHLRWLNRYESEIPVEGRPGLVTSGVRRVLQQKWKCMKTGNALWLDVEEA